MSAGEEVTNCSRPDSSSLAAPAPTLPREREREQAASGASGEPKLVRNSNPSPSVGLCRPPRVAAKPPLPLAGEGWGGGDTERNSYGRAARLEP